MTPMELLSPVPAVAARTMEPVAPLATLHGKRVGFRVEWEPFRVFCDELQTRLRAAGEVAGTTEWETTFQRAGEQIADQRAAELRRFAAGIDAAVVGLAA